MPLRFVIPKPKVKGKVFIIKKADKEKAEAEKKKASKESETLAEDLEPG
jgi:hypothetical protein